MKRFLATAVCLGVSVTWIASCATSPTGRKQLLLLPEGQMNSMGAQAFTDIKKQQPRSSDSKTTSYVQCVAHAVAAHAKDDTGVEKWEVEVFRNEEPNAFALPGGHIGVHTGMLRVARAPDQLAAVLGHEVGHVIAQHGNERVSQALGAQAAMIAAQGLTQGSKYQGVVLAGLGIGAQIGVLLPFSRTHESEADVIGLRLMAEAGFDPHGAVELWENMAKLGGGQPPEFLSTHPAHQTRIENLRRRVPEMMPIYEKTEGKRPNCVPPS